MLALFYKAVYDVILRATSELQSEAYGIYKKSDEKLQENVLAMFVKYRILRSHFTKIYIHARLSRMGFL